MPAGIRADYNEARNLAHISTHAAAALLRSAIQKLCQELGLPGNDLEADIDQLVTAGLPPKIEEALVAVRVIGHEAVLPGTVDLRDDTATVNSLFRLLNFIAVKMITEPREVEAIYAGLPVSTGHE